MVAQHIEVGRPQVKHSRQSLLILQGFGEGFSFPQVIEDPLEFSHMKQ
jgi:hypothetical protein